jgi:mitochondrial chaperone BCS1
LRNSLISETQGHGTRSVLGLSGVIKPLTLSVRYQPHPGFHQFWHKRWPFWFSVDKDRVPGGFLGMMIQDQEGVALTTIGPSTQPIKGSHYPNPRPIPRTTDVQNRHPPPLSKGTARPWPLSLAPRRRSGLPASRPMSTVVLDNCQKALVLRDINDFLHPQTPRWYTNRGIPYRRGYLFHGPPGTGKTPPPTVLQVE